MQRWTAVLSVLLVLALAGISAACPMCKDSISNTDSPVAGGGVGGGGAGGPGGPAATSSDLPHGFNTSVYYMLTGFLTVLGMMVGVLVKGVRSGSVNAPQPAAASISLAPGLSSNPAPSVS